MRHYFICINNETCIVYDGSSNDNNRKINCAAVVFMLSHLKFDCWPLIWSEKVSLSFFLLLLLNRYNLSSPCIMNKWFVRTITMSVKERLKKRMWYLRNSMPTRYFCYRIVRQWKKRWMNEKRTVQIIFGQNKNTTEKNNKLNNLKNVTRCGVCFVDKINVTLTRSSSSRVLFWKNTHAHTLAHYHLFHRKWAKCATHSF